MGTRMDLGKKSSNIFTLSVFGEACRQGRWLIFSVLVVTIVISGSYVLTAEDIYRAEVVAAPTEEAQGSGLGQLAGQLGGLASLAGVNVGEGQLDKSVQAIEILWSRRFLSEFIDKHDIAIPLMAATGWNPITKELQLDDSI